MAGAEPRSRTVDEAADVERAIFRTVLRWTVAVRPLEQFMLPLVPLATRKGGPRTVGDTGLELAAVNAFCGQDLGHDTPVREPAVGVEVERDPGLLADLLRPPLIGFAEALTGLAAYGF
jgi:hypothetical protein